MSAVPPSDVPPADAPLVEMYESLWCGYCRAARRLLDAKGWPMHTHVVDGNAELRRQMTDRSGRTSVPQIWIGATHVGGFDDLAALEDDGELDALYEAAKAAST